MLKRTLAVLFTSFAATAAMADPPATGGGQAQPTGLLDDVRIIFSEVINDFRDSLRHVFQKPKPSTSCRPSTRR